MKNLIILVFSLYMAFSVSGQTPESRFSLDLIYRPCVSFLVNQSELSPMFGYSTGFNFTINTNKGNGFQTGLFFSKKGYSRKHEDYLSDSLKDVLFNDLGRYPLKTKYIWESYFLDIPILYKKSIISNEKANIYFKGGIVVNLLLTNKIVDITHMNDNLKETIVYSYTPAKIPDYDIVKFSASLSCGFKFMASDKIQVLFEPILEYMINPEPISGEVNSHLFTIGVNLGVALF